MSVCVPARALAVLAGLLASAGAAPGGAIADDGVPRLLLDRQLNTTRVRLTSIGGGRVSWIDGAGREHERSIDELLAIIDPEGGLMPEPVRRQVIESLNLPLVQTTDGQRLLARLRPDPEGDDERVELVLMDGQAMRVNIERIASVTSPKSVFDTHEPATADDAPVDDLVELANGDRVRGFVERLGEVVVIEVNGATRRVPMGDVRSIRLANPPRASRDARVWVDDGTVVDVRAMTTTARGVVSLDLALAGEPGAELAGSESDQPVAVRLPLTRLAGILFDAGSVRPLASMSPEGYEPTGDRRWTPPPSAADASVAVLGAPTIELPGPMRVRWRLPDGATRLAGVSTLGDAPGVWADCVVTIWLEDGPRRAELARARLRPAHDELVFNVELPPALDNTPRTLEVHVDAGAYGPIQDRVLLERVLLLVDPG